MFEFLFKYPSPVFTKGKFVLLGTWPGWLLALLIVIAVLLTALDDYSWGFLFVYAAATGANQR